jgi:vitamin B12 transporter
MIDHIEILRGPGSSLYGADGAGGVVQIFTRRGDGKTHVGAWLAAGQYGALEGSVNASGRVGAIDLAGSLSHEQLDGVSALRPNDQYRNYNPDHDGSRRTTAQAQLGWRPVEGQRIGLSVVSNRLNSQYDASEYLPDFTQDPSPDFRNKLDNQLAALEYRAEWSADWTTTLRASTQEDDLHSGGTQIDRFRTRREQLDAQATWRVEGDQRLTFAYEGLTEKASSTNYVADFKRDNNALILAWLGQLGPVSTQADLRHDDNSVYGRVTTGRLGGKVKLDENWRMRALAGTSFRAPSFNDLYYPGYGVPDIQPERGISMEFGVDGRWDDFDVSATAWRNRTRDLIVYESDFTLCPKDPAYQFGCAANVGHARMQGLTLSGGWHSGGWELRGVADFLDAKNTDTGARLNRRAAHQLSLSADYTTGDWRFGAAVLQVGSRPDGSSYQLPEETTLDLKLRWQFAPRWTLEAKVLNATDEDVQPVRDYQGLGRQAWIGVRYAFDAL